MPDDLPDRMRALDDRLAEVPLPPALERRVMASIAERSGSAPRMLVAAAVLAAVVLAFVLGQRMRPNADRPGASPSTPVATAPVGEAPVRPIPQRAWDGALTLDPACVVAPIDDVLAIDSGCRMTLATPALAMETWSSTRIARARDGVRVLAGEIQFAVEPVAPGDPRVRVEVDAGAIEVIGTRFAIVQDDTRGHVDLLEGAIRFVDREGGEHAVVAGRRLQWSDGHLVVPSAPAAPSGARPTTPASAALDLDGTLDSVAALRRAGRHREAVDVLHRARRQLGDGAGAEILSFEEGTLREHLAGGTGSGTMCAFWRGHLARFPAGDYTEAVRGRLARAGCEER
jgi:hypothetical protein